MEKENFPRKSWLLLLFAFLVSDVNPVFSQAPSWKELADKIVNQSARVRAGDMVIIKGGKHTLPLMEEIAAAVHRKGGDPEMVVFTDIALSAFYKEKDDQYLEAFPSHLPVWDSQADIIIHLPGVENLKEIVKDIPPEKMAKISKGWESLTKEYAKANFSNIRISFPTKQQAEVNGIDFPTYEKMHWAAMVADVEYMDALGTKLIQALKNAKQIRITTPSGTDFSFAIGDRNIYKDEGILSEEERGSSDFFQRFAALPGGFVDFGIVETSANGVVNISKNRCKFAPLLNSSFEIVNGKVEKFKAEEGGDCFQKELAPHSDGKFMISAFSIGLNPAMKVMEDQADYRPVHAEGFIEMTIGGNNEFYGGVTKSTGSYSFPLTNATLETDGKVIMKGGKLVL